jgi:DNA-binding CsgD family transcriptional regulator
MVSWGKDKLHSWLTMAFFLVVVLASISDISADISQGSKISHLAQEAVILVFALIILIRLNYQVLKHRRHNKQLQVDMAQMSELSAKAVENLAKAKKEFGEVIAKQFIVWGLSESESEVAWFILKGFNSKEIARYRNLSDKTVRNQLSSVYKKSELKGKQVFISWFMDDLL